MSTQSPGPDSPASEHDPGADDLGAGDPRWRMTPTKWVVSAILLAAIVVPLLGRVSKG